MAFGDRQNTAKDAAAEIRQVMRTARIAATYATQRCQVLTQAFGRAAIAAELNGDGAAMLDLYAKLETFRSTEQGVVAVPLPNP